MLWEKSKIDPDKIRKIAQIANISLLESSILFRRAWHSPEDILIYLKPDVSFLDSPFYFEDIHKVLERLASLTEEDKILIVGDTDVDGIGTTVILYQFLKEEGYKVFYRMPSAKETYGLLKHFVDEAKEEGVSLIITVDCGISDVISIDYANSLGLEVLIFDHHLPLKNLPKAYAIINPQLKGAYRTPTLCATAVVSLIIWAFDFAKTPFYQQEIAFFYLEKQEKYYKLYLIKIKNHIVIESWFETFSVGSEEYSGYSENEKIYVRERLFNFLANSYIWGYRVTEQKKWIKECFGSSVELQFSVDLAYEESFFLDKYTFVQWLKKGPQFFGLNIELSLEQTLERTLFVYYSWGFSRLQRPSFASWYRTLDLVMLSTLADMMPLKLENRIFVSLGLELLKEQRRSCLVKLLQAMNFDYRLLDSTKLSWSLIPVLNSCGRMNQPNVVLRYLLAQDQVSHEDYDVQIQKILSLDRERKKFSQIGFERANSLLYEEEALKKKPYLVVYDSNIHEGITGLVASRLMQQHHKPTIIVTGLTESDLVGSIRTPQWVDARVFIEPVQDLLLSFGGHSQAAGFSLQKTNWNLWVERINKVFLSKELTAKKDVLVVDAFIPPNLFQLPTLWKLSQRFQPFGKEYKELIFASSPVKIIQYKLVGKNALKMHVSLLLKIGSHTVKAMFFNGADALLQLIEKAPVDTSVFEVIFYPNMSFFRHQQEIFMNLVSLQVNQDLSA